MAGSVTTSVMHVIVGLNVPGTPAGKAASPAACARGSDDPGAAESARLAGLAKHRRRRRKHKLHRQVAKTAMDIEKVVPFDGEAGSASTAVRVPAVNLLSTSAPTFVPSASGHVACSQSTDVLYTPAVEPGPSLLPRGKSSCGTTTSGGAANAGPGLDVDGGGYYQ